MIGALHIPQMEFDDDVPVPPLKAIIVGNNAVANLEMYTAFRTMAEGLGNQVAQGNESQAALSAKWKECDEHFVVVHFGYIDEILSDAWVDVEECIELERPDIP